MSVDLMTRLSGVERLEHQLELQKADLLQKAFSSNDPATLIKANQMVANIQPYQQVDRKSYVFDPYDASDSSGFKEKAINVSYETLRRISYAVPIVRAIINTRIDQVCAFCDVQTDKYSTGFRIQKKRNYYDQSAASTKPTRQEIKEMVRITDIILDCGVNPNYNNYDFDTFTRMVMNDSLSLDQLNWENEFDRKGRLYAFSPVDAATVRIASSVDNESNGNNNAARFNSNWGKPLNTDRKQKNGYMPAYCQIIDGRVSADFYPWEMMFGVRNPTTSIYSNGYGVSEIEVLINTITSMLWADEYNRRFFSQGSSPKGFLKIKPMGGGLGVGGGSSSKIADFKQKWNSMMVGFTNAHKTPILEADVDWVDLQKTNREMEFSHWIEFLIKICCAIWRIDPAEINFPLSGGSDQKAMFEGNNEARLKHSKDKGLFPLLKFYQRKMNKIVKIINPDYEFVFVGINGEDPSTELDMDVKRLSNFCTVDEIRVKGGLKPLGKENGGDLVLNSVWYQAYMMKQQAQQQGQPGAPGQQGDAQQGQGQADGQQDENQGQGDGISDEELYGGGQGYADGAGEADANESSDNNPIQKAFDSYFTKSVLN